MTPATSPPPTAPPGDPVRAALDDPDLRAELIAHAVARLRGLLADRPVAVRFDMAEDAVQDALKRAVERQATFDPAAGTSPAGWVHGILNNVLSEHCRAIRKQPAQPPTDPAVWENLATLLEPANARAALAEFLAHLPDEMRRIIDWHHLQGLSHREIAARLGISEQNSRVRLARAMTEIKRLVAESEGGR